MDLIPRAQFDWQPHLEGPTLLLAPLQAGDFDSLYAAASDPLVWAGHPAKDRHLEAVFRPYFDMLLASGSTLAVRSRPTGEIIGCSRYYVAPGTEGDVSIGFTFLRRDFWGGSTNREMKTLMFEHAFECFEAVWLHIAPDNIRSQRATRKLGAVFMREEELDLGDGAKSTACFRITHTLWQAQQ